MLGREGNNGATLQQLYADDSLRSMADGDVIGGKMSGGKMRERECDAWCSGRVEVAAAQ